MAKYSNGTIDLARFQQLHNQRDVIKQRNENNLVSSNLGVASETNINVVFKDSPLILANRRSDARADITRDPSSLQVESGDIYEMYSNAIDPINDSGIVSGLGFSGQPHIDDPNGDRAYMNYRHPDNPFLGGDYSALTSGEKYSQTKAYRGFPDLDVSEVNLSQPSIDQDVEPSSDIQIESNQVSNFGNTTEEYRSSISEIVPESLGRHAPASIPQNGTEDTLGQYFRTNVVGNG